MAAESPATAWRTRRFEAGKLAQFGILSVSTDKPARSDNPAFHQQPVLRQPCNPTSPMQRDTTCRGAIHKPLMQYGATNSETHTAREAGFDFAASVDKSNPMERRDITRIDINAQCRQRRQPIRHDAFATCFIDGWPRTIDNRHLEACLAGSDCGCKSGGPATGNENFSLLKGAHATSAVRRVPSRIPDPWRQECCKCRPTDGVDS